MILGYILTSILLILASLDIFEPAYVNLTGKSLPWSFYKLYHAFFDVLRRNEIISFIIALYPLYIGIYYLTFYLKAHVRPSIAALTLCALYLLVYFIACICADSGLLMFFPIYLLSIFIINTVDFIKLVKLTKAINASQAGGDAS